jgi:transcription factor TGA
VRPHLEPLTDQQLISVCGLQQTSTQAEDAMFQGMEKLQHNVTETLTVVDTFFSDEAYMLKMDNAVDRLKELVVFVAEVSDQPNRCRT